MRERYRWLLWAYPGPYRRRHGSEIRTTLLDLAGSGRPQGLHLVACGLRQRFRLPAGRPLAVIAAVLTAVVVGALGAAAGTWLGWQTAAPVPSGEATRSLSAHAAGGKPIDVETSRWRTAMRGPATTATVTIPTAYSAERVRAALLSAGWHLTSFTEVHSSVAVVPLQDPPVLIPAPSVRFTATRDGLRLDGDSMTTTADPRYGVARSTAQRLDVWAEPTAAVPALTIAGPLAGAVAGWLIAAALADRIRRTGRARRRVAAALSTVALAAAVPPALALYRGLYQVLTYDRGAPDPYIVDNAFPHTGLIPSGTVAALAALALIVFARTRTGPELRLT